MLDDVPAHTDFGAVIGAAPDYHLVIDRDAPKFSILAASRAFLRLCGATKQEVVGRSGLEFLPEPADADGQGYAELFSAVLREGKPRAMGTLRFDTPHPDRPDTLVERHWSARSQPIFGDDGQVCQILYTFDEVTDFVLRQRFRKRDKPGAASPEKVVVWTDDPFERRWMAELFASQWQVEVVDTADGALAAVEENRADALVAVVDMANGHSEALGQISELTQGALPVIVRLGEANSSRSYEDVYELGAADVVVGPISARELVARVQAQLSAFALRRSLLKRARRRFDRLFDLAPFSMALLEGPEHIYVLSNPTHRALSGGRDLRGQRIADVYPADIIGDVVDVIDRVYQTGEPAFHHDMPVAVGAAPPLDDVEYVSFAFLPFRDLDGAVAGVASFGFDVTDVVRARKDVEQQASRLEEQNRRKDAFLAMLGHELRNPLAPIMTGIEVLELCEDEPTPERVQWAANIISRQVDQLSRLVDDLLDIAHINRGQITLEQRPSPLSAFVDAAVETVRPHMKSRRQRLDVDVEVGDEVSFEVDVERMTQVVANLLTNASKYTPEEGNIRLSAQIEGGELVLCVEDDGRGIPAEMIGRIFDLFTQVDASLDRSEGGLGLGLTLVRQIVEMHQGRVEAHSDGPDTGSKFTIRLPVVCAEQQAVGEPRGVGCS